MLMVLAGKTSLAEVLEKKRLRSNDRERNFDGQSFFEELTYQKLKETSLLSAIFFSQSKDMKVDGNGK